MNVEWLLIVLVVVVGVVGLGWVWLDYCYWMLVNGLLGCVSVVVLYLDNIYNGLIVVLSWGIVWGLDVVDWGVDVGLSGVVCNVGVLGVLFVWM